MQVPVNKTLTRLDKHIVICLAAGARDGAAAGDHFLTRPVKNSIPLWALNIANVNQKVIDLETARSVLRHWIYLRRGGWNSAARGQWSCARSRSPGRGPTLFYVWGCNSVAPLMKPINHVRQWAHAEFTPLARDTSALDYLRDCPRLHTTVALSLQ